MSLTNHGADSPQSDLTAGSGKRRESNTRGWWLRRGSLIRKGKEREFVDKDKGSHVLFPIIYQRQIMGLMLSLSILDMILKLFLT